MAITSPERPASTQSVHVRSPEPDAVKVRRAGPLTSTVGLKALMAVTGILMLLFLLLHMLGNLKIFFGPEGLNGYAHWLRTLGEPALRGAWFLWIERFVLTFVVVGHIYAAAVLTLRSRAARPVKYVHRKPVNGSYAARTMRWGGVIVLLFIVFHLLDLTAGVANPKAIEGDPYANVVADFQPGRWYVTLFYVLALVAVGFHIRHGIFSAARTLGQRTPKGERRIKAFALGFSVFLIAGYVVVPISVMAGLVS